MIALTRREDSVGFNEGKMHAENQRSVDVGSAGYRGSWRGVKIPVNVRPGSITHLRGCVLSGVDPVLRGNR